MRITKSNFNNFRSPMAEIKYKFDYTEPENVESEVPGEQKLRENLDNSAIEKATVWDEDKIETPEDYILAPVVTITKNEATFTKGDMKLQKVTVTENVSVSFQHLFKKQTLPGKTVVTQVQKFEYKY